MLDAGGVKREEVEQIDEIGDTPAGMEKVKAYRAAVGRQYHKTGEYDTRLSDTDRKPSSSISTEITVACPATASSIELSITSAKR
jgi:hypothetical protein